MLAMLQLPAAEPQFLNGTISLRHTLSINIVMLIDLLMFI